MDPDTAETTSMGQKGQVVIPKAVRNRHGLGPHTKFLVYSSGDMIVMKKLTMPDLKEMWEEVYRSMDEKNIQLTQEEINEEIRAVRAARRKGTQP